MSARFPLRTPPEMPDSPADSGYIYIAGPMSIVGPPDYNYQAFYDMAHTLRTAGYTVISPAELHEPGDRPWDWYLRRDLRELVKCSRVVLLEAWHLSPGACLERNVAEALGLEIIAPHNVYEKLLRPAYSEVPQRIVCGDPL